MKQPTPKQCAISAEALKLAAKSKRKDGYADRARILEQASEIMEAKAFVGAIADAWVRSGKRQR